MSSFKSDSTVPGCRGGPVVSLKAAGPEGTSISTSPEMNPKGAGRKNPEISEGPTLSHQACFCR